MVTRLHKALLLAGENQEVHGIRFTYSVLRNSANIVDLPAGKGTL